MKPTIRPARLSDRDVIAEFTTDTFEWGDYIADVFAEWLDDPDGQIMVAVDDADRAIAVGRGLMLSHTELWLQGIRVHGDWRRRGLASAMGEALVAWSRARGAQVARLVIEEWNAAAQEQVTTIEFRPVGKWVVASRAIAASSPTTPTNGGQRAKARRKLERAHSSEAVPAWISWRSGPLLRPTRGLFANHWRWSQLEMDHLARAAKRGDLWSSQAGWAHIHREEDHMAVGWLECGPDDATDMVRSLVDLATSSGVERIQIYAPDEGWLVAALQASNCELHPMVIYERGL